MKRRSFMLGAAGTVAGMVFLPDMANADPNRIDWYMDSDTNVLDFWANIVKPKFEAANPGITLNLVDGGSGGGLIQIAQRALAALQSKQDPQADMFEDYDPRLPAGAMDAGLFVDLSKAGLKNFSRVNPVAVDTNYNMAMRGSQVLLAYDNTKLSAADAPNTWDKLVAWIKANPGQFVYCRPDKGGSGNNFVQRAIYEANGRDPSKFTVNNFDAAKAKAALDPAWALLNDIGPSVFNKGAYTSGNTQSVQLLSQSAVTMITAWSDQALSSIEQGVLPETTGLIQLEDLAFPGSYTHLVVLANGANKDAALKLADFVLNDDIQAAVVTELGGFPGIDWQYLPADMQAKFKPIMAKQLPSFPGGDWTEALTDGWYRNVAPGVDRTS